MQVVLKIWEKQKDTVEFSVLQDSGISENIFCSWLLSCQKKIISIDIWNDTFKRVQGHISKLSVSICGSQSLKKLNSCFQFIKSVANGDTDDQALSEVSSWHVDFPLKILSWVWQSENAGDGAFGGMYVLKLPSRIQFECFYL